MITNIAREVKHAILLDPQHLKRLWAILNGSYSDVHFQIKCSDGSRIVGKCLDDLIGFNNGSSRKITRMFLNGENGPSSNCNVYFFESSYSGTDIEISDGDDAVALKVASEVQKCLLDSKPWYSFAARIPAGLVISVVAALPYMFHMWSQYLRFGRIVTSDTSIIAIMIMTLPLVVIYVFGLNMIDRFWRWMFPRSFFLIGRQVENWKIRIAVRKFVFGTVIFGSVLGIAINLVSSKF